MYRKRSYPQRRSFPMRRNFRSRLHTPSRPQRWQAANFNITQNYQLGPAVNDPQNIVFLLALIDNRVGDGGTPQGRTLNNLARSMEVGGIVFDYAFVMTPTPGSFVGGDPEFCIQHQVVLATDRLDADGNPAAIDTNWFTNTPPIAAALATETQDEDERFPTRIHHRRSHAFDLGITPGVNATGDLKSGHSTYPAQGRSSIRLRLRYSDEQALVLHVASIIHTMNSAFDGADIFFMFTGTLYYRVRF